MWPEGAEDGDCNETRPRIKWGKGAETRDEGSRKPPC